MENRCCCDFRVGRFRLSEQGSCSSGNWSVFLFEVKCSSDERCDKDCKGDKLYLLKIVSFLVDLVKMRRKEEESLSLLCTLLISLSLSAKNRNLFWMVIWEKRIVANGSSPRLNGIGIPRDPPGSIRPFLRCHTLDHVLEAGGGLVNLRSDDG